MSHVIQTRLIGNFLGAKPGAQYPLANGQVWAQVEEIRRFSYALHPAVTIRLEGTAYVMHVAEAEQSVRVVRVR